MQKYLGRVVGAVGVLLCLTIFISKPSFPTPDKLLIFGMFVFMVVGQATELLKRFVPFVALLLAYESFRGIVPELNKHVNFTLLPAADKLLFFGNLPTVWLQQLLWRGHAQWYDFVFYLAYMMHFVLPLGLAVLIWKTHPSHYWRYVTAYVGVSFAGFLTFLAFPAAPPWLASDLGYIPHIARVSSSVWFALGIKDFPSVYNSISPNPVAAMPSLHAAYGTLFALFMIKTFKTKWRYLAWIHPLLIYIGTVYQGEHYVIDIIFGILFAVTAYFVSPVFLRFIQRRCIWLGGRYKQLFTNASKDSIA